MKKQKILFLLIITFSILMLFSLKVEATLELNELDFDAQINEDGSMNVTETWDIYISETNTLFKTFEIDRNKYSNITDVNVAEIIGNENSNFTKINQEMYHVTKNCYYGLINSKGQFEIAWGVGLDNSSDTRKYQISYKVNDVIAQYNDYSELYWKFIGDNFEISAKKVNGVITLPRNVQIKDDIKIWGHTEDLNGEIYVKDLNKIEFTINRYSGGKYVEVRSLFPNDIITSTSRKYNVDILNKVINEETIWANEANARREARENFQKGIVLVIGIIALFFTYKAIKNIKKLFTMEKKYKPTTKLEYFRELPYEDATPAEAIFMMTSGIDTAFSASFSANILDLCLNKYITLEVIQKGGVFKKDIVKIKILSKEDKDLKDDEKLTLNLLKEIAKGDELTTENITKYFEKHVTKIESLNKRIENIVELRQIQNKNYSKENNNKKVNYAGISGVYGILLFCSFFAVVALSEMSMANAIVGIVLAIALLANTIILGIMAGRVNVLTQKGVDEKEQWTAFKKYMEEFSLLKDKEIPSLVLWEKYLVFATAFGISEKVLKQLKVIYPEIADMNSALYNYSYIHVMNTVDIGKCINNSVYSAIGSSGSGAGGGFSGGGGGGRWPEVAVADAKI